MSLEQVRLDYPLAEARLLAHGEAAMELLLARARAEGERAGRAAAGTALDAAVLRLNTVEEELRASLAHTAAELARGNYDLEKIVRETLGEASVGRSACVVHLHPADHARLADVRFRSGTRLEPDEGVARGDVHVETSLGLMVRDLDGALESIAKRLQEDLG